MRGKLVLVFLGSGGMKEPIRRLSSTDIPGQSCRPSGTKLMRRVTRPCGGIFVMSSPRSDTRPLLIGNTPASVFRVVVFPAPFGPIMQVTWPWRAEKEIPQRTCTSPYCTSRFSTSKRSSPGRLATGVRPQSRFTEIGLNDGMVVLNFFVLAFSEFLAKIQDCNFVADRHDGLHIVLNVKAVGP